MNETTSQPPFGAGFFSWLRGLGIVRGSDRWFAGVAGGVAARANIDPIIVRGIFVVLAILGGPGVILYLAAWLLLPDTAGRIHLEEVFRGRAQTAAIVALVSVCVLLFLPIVLRLVGGITFGGWDFWFMLGVPEWVSTTVSVLIWIVVVTAISILIGMMFLKHGRAVRDGERSGERPASPASAAAPASAAHDAHTTSATSATSAPNGTPSDTITHEAPTTTEAPSASASEAPADAWTQRLSDGADKFSERATQWGENVSKQTDEWSARYAEYHDDHKLGAAHLVITLAFTLIAAGAAALWAHNLSVSSTNVLIAALIGGTGALALSLIVAGIRGRHTGWVGFLAFCGVIALVITSLLPGNTRFQPFGVVDVTYSEESSLVLAGSSRVDLTPLDEVDEARELVVWNLVGNVRVKLPEDHPVVVNVYVLAGNIHGPSPIGGATTATAGPFLSRTIDTRVGDEPATEVSVYMVAGNVRVGDISLVSGRELAEHISLPNDSGTDSSEKGLDS